MKYSYGPLIGFVVGYGSSMLIHYLFNKFRIRRDRQHANRLAKRIEKVRRKK